MFNFFLIIVKSNRKLVLAAILHVIPRILGRHNNKNHQVCFHEALTQIRTKFKWKLWTQFNMTWTHPLNQHIVI